MKLSELTSGLPICVPEGTDNPDISSVTEHSDRVVPGGVFVCVRGLHRDGSDFAPEAKAKGARMIVSETPLDGIGIPVLRTPDARKANAYLQSRLSGDPGKRLKLFFVTGTNGKTTVSFLIREILRRAGRKTGLIGTVTNGMTTPDPEEFYPLLRSFADDGCDTVVAEASSHALALGKLAPLTPDYAVFTNLTPEHLDFHKDMEHYFEAKASLFRSAKTGIINLDDPYGRLLLSLPSEKAITYSLLDDGADFTAKSVCLLGTSGIRYECLNGNRLFRIVSPIPGQFTVPNTLAAAAAASADGIPSDLIRQAIAGMRGVPGRLERVPIPRDDFAVYIDFAHTPDALENVLRAVRGFMTKKQRLILLFGCGGDRDRSKRSRMGTVAARLSDFAIVTSDNPRSEEPEAIISEILAGIPGEFPHIVIRDRRDAIAYAIASAAPGDVILLAGKGHETYEIDKNGAHGFSEKETVLEAVRKK